MALNLLGTYSANNNLNVTSVTVPNVVVSGSDTMTVVQLCTYENTSSAARVGVSVVRNGENFTRLDSATIDDGETNGQRIETWYKLGASTGTSDIVCTVTGACNQVSAFVTVSQNIVQAAPSIVDTQEDATGTAHALTLTTTKNGSLIMGAIYTWDTTVSAMGTNQTQIASLDAGYLLGSYEIVGNAGNHDHSYSTGSNSRCVYSAVVITPILTDVAVRASSNNGSATGTAMSVAMPTGTQAGDVVIVVAHGNTDTTIVDNNGSTPFTEDLNDLHPNPSSGHTVSIFSRRIQSGDPSTYNFTLGASGRWTLVAVAIKDVDPTNIYDVSIYTETVDNASAGALEIDSITTLTDKAIHFLTLSWDTGSTGTITLPSGYTDASSRNTNQPTAVCYKVITPAGATGAKTLDNTEFGTRIGTAFAIKNTVVAVGDLSISKSEAITVSETKALVTSGPSINETESVTITESVGIRLASFIVETESITVTDSETVVTSDPAINELETITVSETHSVLLPDSLAVNVSQAVTVTEAPIMDVTVSVNEAESITVSTTPIVPDPSNLIQNGSFELDALSEFPAGWTDYSETGTPVFKAVDNEFASDGTQAFKIFTVGASDFGIKQQITGLTIGMRYTLRSWIKTDATITRAIIALDTTLDGAGGSLTEVTTVADSVEGYYTVELIADATTINAFLGIGSFGDDSEGSVWWDEVSLIASTVDTHYVNESESISLTETVTVVIADALSINETESITLSEAVVSYVVTQINETETITITETHSVVLPDSLSVSVSESIEVTDLPALTADGIFTISVVETITVTESVSLAAIEENLFLAVDDFVVVLDDTALDIGIDLTSSDSVTVSETVVAEHFFTLSVLELITVTAEPSISFGKGRKRSIGEIKSNSPIFKVNPNRPRIGIRRYK